MPQGVTSAISRQSPTRTYCHHSASHVLSLTESRCLYLEPKRAGSAMSLDSVFAVAALAAAKPDVQLLWASLLAALVEIWDTNCHRELNACFVHFISVRGPYNSVTAQGVTSAISQQSPTRTYCHHSAPHMPSLTEGRRLYLEPKRPVRPPADQSLMRTYIRYCLCFP